MRDQGDELLAWICAEPADDVPRLIYADYLEEHGAGDYARFIREQIALAQLPSWHVRRVRVKWRQRKRHKGEAFHGYLPELKGSGASWTAEPWRRGLPAVLRVNTLACWEQVEARLWQRAPIEQIELAAAWTLEQLRDWSRSPLLSTVRSLVVAGNPIEVLRTLQREPGLPRLESLTLLHCSGAGLSIALEDFLQSPTGQRLKELHLSVGLPHQVPYVLEALAAAPSLQALTLVNMGLLPEHLPTLLQLPAVQTVQMLDLSVNSLGMSGVYQLLATWPPRLHTLKLVRIDGHSEPLSQRSSRPDGPSVPPAQPLACLDLSLNSPQRLDFSYLLHQPVCRQVHSLALRGCYEALDAVQLVQLPCWPHLVELDLRNNCLDTLRPLRRIRSPLPSKLTAVVVSDHCLPGRWQSRSPSWQRHWQAVLVKE